MKPIRNQIHMMLLWITFLIAFPAYANANLIELDFRDAAQYGGAGEAFFTTTITAIGAELTISANPGGAVLWRDDMDGYGVQKKCSGLWYYDEKDEIQGPEYLSISFSQPVILMDASITDLFHENGYQETGFYSLNRGGTWVNFMAETDQLPGISNGKADVSIDAMAESVLFAAPGMMAGQMHDFSVAGLRIYADLDMANAVHTPLPPAVLLFGSGILGLGLCRHRCSKNRREFKYLSPDSDRGRRGLRLAESSILKGE